jgi:acyl carrier protein
MNIETLIAEHLGVDVAEVTDEKSLIEDLGADSLHTVELIIQFESQYDIEISDEDAETLTTVGSIKEYIKNYE